MNASPPPRLASLDAYRGFVMLLMMAEVLHLGRMARNFPDSPFWSHLGDHQSHVEWRGCSLHDLIQPSFSFLVGVSLAFSLINRERRGQTRSRMLLHAVWRAVVLVLLGVFLRSIGKPQTYWTFEDTLSQIGFGYVPLVLLGLAKPLWRYAALGVLLVGYWAAFALYPAPAPDFFRTHDVGVKADWKHHPGGFAAHWDKNSNAAWAFDTWFLNLFPRQKPFEFNDGGYATLSFVPTLATMLLGLLAGTRLVAGVSGGTVARFLVAGAALVVLGLGLDYFGVCPSVKRIWTPSWTLFSGGACFFLLAFFVVAADLSGSSGWAYPLKVIGANSIVAYVGCHLVEDFLLGSFRTHLGADVFQGFGKAYEPIVSGLVLLAVYWLVLWWLYAKRIFIRI